MTEIDYQELLGEMEEKLEQSCLLVLSTSKNDHVTSRTVCYANQNLEVYILTGKRSTKCKQIMENARVSLCLDHLQIQGEAKLLGSPLKAENLEIGRWFFRRNPDYYKRFAHFKAAELIWVKCHKITQWKFEDGKDFYYVLDVVKQRAVKHR